MASAWAKDLPVVTVTRGAAAKHVTLIVPYYDSPVFLRQQSDRWKQYAPDLQAHLSVIVVDDGSPRWPAERLYEPFSFRLFRIDVNVPWNWLAARNIGAHRAADGWLLLTDMDHVVPGETLKALIYGEHDPAVVYGFSRRESSGADIPPHSASFFMTRDLFWKIGGYDERLSGVYGTDGVYRRRVLAKAPVKILSDALIRYEHVADASVTTYERKTPAMEHARHLRLASLPPGPPKTLSFPYHEVTA